jgi:hypothetical protein
MNEQEVNKKSYDFKLIQEKKIAEEKLENLRYEAREFWKSVYLKSLELTESRMPNHERADLAYQSFENRFITKKRTL